MPAALPTRFELARPIYHRRIRDKARRNYRLLPGVDAVEIEQELLEVLWLCCEAYDPDKGAKFQTYFWTAAEHRLRDLHKAASRQMRVGDYFRVSLDGSDIREMLTGSKLMDSAEEEALANMHVIEIFRSAKK